MAPYLGLLTERGELRGKHYVRKDMSDMLFKISPQDERTLVILNSQVIAWHHLEGPGTVSGIGLFADVLGDQLITSVPVSYPVGPLGNDDTVDFRPGGLRIGTSFKSDAAGRNIAPEQIEQASAQRDVRLGDALFALQQIVDAPKSAPAELLRAIARKALQEAGERVLPFNPDI